MVHQNSTVTAAKLILGNVKIETAAYGTTVAGAWVNCGAGILNNIKHNIEKFDTQAGNAPDPIEGISNETLTFSGELIEWDASVLAAISCGAMTKSTGASGVTIISAGGNTTLTERAFKITNTRLIGAVTQTSVWLVFKAAIDNGVEWQLKSDNDTDPIAIMPIALTAKCDATLTAGSQLFTMTHTYNG